VSEDALWLKARRELSPWGCLHRVENAADLGTPDVAYALRVQGAAGSGWIELKHVEAWPKKLHTPFSIPKLTHDQVAFARSWAAAGGQAWTLVQVGRGYWLLDPSTIAAVYDGAITAPGIRRVAAAGSDVRFPLGDVLRALVR